MGFFPGEVKENRGRGGAIEIAPGAGPGKAGGVSGMFSELWYIASSLLWLVLAVLTAIAGIVVFRRGARMAGALLAGGGVASFGSAVFWFAFHVDRAAGWHKLARVDLTDSLFPVVNGISSLSGLLNTAGLVLLAAAYCRLVRRLRDVENLPAR